MFENIYENKRVLVTGHTGFKGSWLSLWLRKLGAEVAGFSNGIPTEPSHYEVTGLRSFIEDFEGDVRCQSDLARVFKTFRPEIVFHLAAQPIVSTSLENPIDTLTTNTIGSANVLEQIRMTEDAISAVMITSDKCYENLEWEYGYRETDWVGGKDPYSASKGAAEIVFHSYYRSFIKDLFPRVTVATARAGNVIGGGDWAKDRLVPDCMKSWAAEKSPEIRSPNATRPWQHVLEPLSGYLQLGASLLKKSPKVNGESFNFGPSHETTQTVGEMLQEMAKVWSGKTWTVNETELSKKEAGLLRLSCDKALHRLSWTPTLDFKETIEYTTEWYKQFYTSKEDIIQLTEQHIESYISRARELHKVWT